MDPEFAHIHCSPVAYLMTMLFLIGMGVSNINPEDKSDGLKMRLQVNHVAYKSTDASLPNDPLGCKSIFGQYKEHAVYQTKSILAKAALSSSSSLSTCLASASTNVRRSPYEIHNSSPLLTSCSVL